MLAPIQATIPARAKLLKRRYYCISAFYTLNHFHTIEELTAKAGDPLSEMTPREIVSELNKTHWSAL